MNVSGWGKFPIIAARQRAFDTEEALRPLLQEGPAITRGLGRSYGDSALASYILSATSMDALLAFDDDTGMLECEAGLSLRDIVAIFVPRGWFMPVTPGTRDVTVGGAVAADVHGKNHHRDGCFSQHVESFRLMLPDGSVEVCSRTRQQELFAATCGGMGLTGVILSVRFRLRRIGSSRIEQRTILARNLDEVLELFAHHADTTYSVAWIDCLTRGKHLGRSVLMLGEHAPAGSLELTRRSWPAVPPIFPGQFLNPLSVRLFNAFYYRMQGRKPQTTEVELEPFFYPLDAVPHWNRLYGKNGFLQYQFILPHNAAREGIRHVLERISAERLGSFLAVLKMMGPANKNPLSFPLEGVTLALDFKRTPRVLQLLDELDGVVLDHGGRFYLAKDARMDKGTFEAGYPAIDGFRELRNRLGLREVFQSMQSRRLDL